ncbi:hypothetical protein [Nocardia wallacei]|uniref:hypothetical protein n=1 Tax=Nocardia wallacei TaxID=480035 RepID=UPI002454C441|nr:hypothetical protein [Nocardia wallacei]
MLEIGQRVRIGERGVSVFEVVEIDDAAHMLFQSAEADVSGRYPLSMRVQDLVPVDSE